MSSDVYSISDEFPRIVALVELIRVYESVAQQAYRTRYVNQAVHQLETGIDYIAHKPFPVET